MIDVQDKGYNLRSRPQFENDSDIDDFQGKPSTSGISSKSNQRKVRFKDGSKTNLEGSTYVIISVSRTG